MCMSFTDLTLDRQEKLIMEVFGWATDGSRDSKFWALKLPHYEHHISKVYSEMDTADLVVRRENATTNGHAFLVGLITAELEDRARLAAAADQIHQERTAETVAVAA